MLVAYTLRNLWARRAATAPILISIAIAVMGSVLVRASLQSFFGSILGQADPDDAVVVPEGIVAEDQATLPQTFIAQADAARGASPNSAISAEVLSQVLVRGSHGELGFVTVRGVDAGAYSVHRNVKIDRGQPPEHGELGILVGRQVYGRYVGLAEGGEVEIGRHRWKVVGTFSAAGSQLESEVWVDRPTLMTELQRKEVNSIHVRLGDDSSTFDRIAKVVADYHERPLELVRAPELQHRAVAELTELRAASTLMELILFVGSSIACASAMYTSLIGRRRELATLLAIGFTRRRVGALLLLESGILAGVGGLVGLALALPLDGQHLSVGDARYYTLVVSSASLLRGLGMAAVVGLNGGLISILAGRRLEVLSALRS